MGNLHMYFHWIVVNVRIKVFMNVLSEEPVVLRSSFSSISTHVSDIGIFLQRHAATETIEFVCSVSRIFNRGVLKEMGIRNLGRTTLVCICACHDRCNMHRNNDTSVSL